MITTENICITPGELWTSYNYKNCFSLKLYIITDQMFTAK